MKQRKQRVIQPEMVDKLSKIFDIQTNVEYGFTEINFDDEAPLPTWAAGLHRGVFEIVAGVVVFECMHDIQPSGGGTFCFVPTRTRQSERDFIDFISTQYDLYILATKYQLGLTTDEIVMAKLMGEDAFEGSALEKKLFKWFKPRAVAAWVRIHDQLLIVA